VEPEGSLPATWAIPGQLEQVFINLSLNALDAMPEGGTLTVRSHQENGRIEVRIEDTGAGIPPEIGRRVFEPFFTTKEPGRGTGLGLSVSYGIVQKHRGTIDLESTVNRGTVFTVRLPVLETLPEPEHVASNRSTR
jgi:two-component system NtrC family sensor kinase